MSNQNIENNDVNGAGTFCEGSSSGRCSPAQQRGPGRNPTTARMKWSKEVNKVVMECFYRSEPFDVNGKPIRGYRQRMFREWRDRGMFEATEQRVCDQARAIRKNGWLSDLELEMIKRSIKEEEEGTVEVSGDGESVIDDEVNEMNVPDEREVDRPVIRYSVIVENDVNHVFSESRKEIFKSLEQILMEGKSAEGIHFKNVDKNKLRYQVNRVNEVIHHIRTENITETNNLIRSATVWVAEQR